MAEYHVKCGLGGIYAGTLKKSGDEWKNSNLVTDEAIDAVIGYLYLQMGEEANAIAYAVKLKDGKYARLKLEVSDKCPEWAKKDFEVEDGQN